MTPRNVPIALAATAALNERGWLHGWWDGTPLAVNLATGSGIRFFSKAVSPSFESIRSREMVGAACAGKTYDAPIYGGPDQT